MDVQSALVVILTALVIILFILLIRRHRAERNAPPADDLNAAGFEEFLRTNAVDGDVQAVARKVSDLLKNAVACERIVFLRKQRGFMELNYYHGINRFNRQQFRMRYSEQLADSLRGSFGPEPISGLRRQLPDDYVSRLESFGFEYYFPIFWRQNLYGLYFVKANAVLTPDAFRITIAGIAQALSAAYHIKWHESRYEKLARRLEQTATEPAQPTASASSAPRILKLVRHRNSETLVTKLVASLQVELNLDRLAYLYEPKEKSQAILIYTPRTRSNIPTPDPAAFDSIVKSLPRDSIVEVDRVLDGQGVPSDWARTVRNAGITHAAYFPATDRRRGLLLFGGSFDPQAVATHMRQLAPAAQDLVANAELYEKVEEMSFTDNLTGVANQRYFRKRLHEELTRAARYQRSLALIIFDMDGLKAINDRYGHLAGDRVLRRLGQMLKGSIRAIDIVARYGGDEFCVIMPEADDATCLRFMSRLQEKIVSSRFHLDKKHGDINCTISQGAAVFPVHAANETDLIYAADMALLRAKESGRNTYLVYDHAMRETTA
jgi:diguanylate cyclase (GGDEF)-like protein